MDNYVLMSGYIAIECKDTVIGCVRACSVYVRQLVQGVDN